MNNNEDTKKMRAMLSAELEADPLAARGKKLTVVLLIVWIATRLLALVLERVCARIGYVDAGAVNIVGIVMALAFSLLIYGGAVKAAFLPLAGGILMVVSSFRDRLYPMLGYGLDPVLTAYFAAFILAAWAQLLIMLALLFLSSCKAYGEAAMRVGKRFKNGTEGPHL